MVTAVEIDDYAQKTVTFIDPKTVKMLSKLTPWRSILQIVLEWFGIGVAILLCETYWSPLLYLAVVFWVGARQNALVILMHEATHYRLLPNRAWNEWVGEIFTAWPLMISVNGYRQTHFPHHRFVNEDNDPDRQMLWRNAARYYPRSMRSMIIISLKYLLGYYALAELVGVNQESTLPPKVKYLRLAFYVAVLAASIGFSFWFELLIYWLVPLSTVSIWLVFIRSITEHSIENHDDLLKKTRHVDASFFERLMISPNYIQVHIAHHLYPSIPFYNLKKVQKLLMQNAEFAKRAHISKGYVSLIKSSIEDNKVYFNNRATIV